MSYYSRYTGAEIDEYIEQMSNLPLKPGTGKNSLMQSGAKEASGENSVAFGKNTRATGQSSFAEGSGTESSATESHSEGKLTKATGPYSHAEGQQTIASGSSAHAEGETCKATGIASHAEGSNTEASGGASHSEGDKSKAGGSASHAEGIDTRTQNSAEHAQGKYNVSTKSKTVHSVGIGTSDDNRKNAEEIHTDGKKYIIGIGGYDGTNSTTEGTKSVQDVINGLVDRTSDQSIEGQKSFSDAPVFLEGITLGKTKDALRIIDEPFGVLRIESIDNPDIPVTLRGVAPPQDGYDAVSLEYIEDYIVPQIDEATIPDSKITINTINIAETEDKNPPFDEWVSSGAILVNDKPVTIEELFDYMDMTNLIYRRVLWVTINDNSKKVIALAHVSTKMYDADGYQMYFNLSTVYTPNGGDETCILTVCFCLSYINWAVVESSGVLRTKIPVSKINRIDRCITTSGGTFKGNVTFNDGFAIGNPEYHNIIQFISTPEPGDVKELYAENWRIAGLSEPVAGYHAATKKYVDNNFINKNGDGSASQTIKSNLRVKDSIELVSTQNIDAAPGTYHKGGIMFTDSDRSYGYLRIYHANPGINIPLGGISDPKREDEAVNKRTFDKLVKRVEALEKRVEALENPTPYSSNEIIGEI